MATKSSAPIEIRPLKFETILVPVVGTSELIMHKWSEKAIRMIEDKQQKKATAKRETRNPQEDYESSIYRDEFDNIVFPASGFKAAIVGSCRQFDGIPMTLAKQIIRVNGEWVKIEGEPYLRRDMVRLETGVADVRYRAGFKKWSAVLSITFNANILSKDMIVNMVQAAGFGGIGEWRPSAPKSATGSFGCFEVDLDKEILGE